MVTQISGFMIINHAMSLYVHKDRMDKIDVNKRKFFINGNEKRKTILVMFSSYLFVLMSTSWMCYIYKVRSTPIL